MHRIRALFPTLGHIFFDFQKRARVFSLHPGNFLGNLRVRTSDPQKRLPVVKFLKYFCLKHSKRTTGEGGWEGTLQVPLSSSRILLLPKNVLLFAELPFYFPELPFYFPEMSFCFLELPFCFRKVSFSFPEVPFYFSKMPYCFPELSLSFPALPSFYFLCASFLFFQLI